MGVCEVRGCKRELLARGLCSMHYYRQRRGSSLGPAQSYYDQAPSAAALADRRLRTRKLGVHFRRLRAKAGEGVWTIRGGHVWLGRSRRLKLGGTPRLHAFIRRGWLVEVDDVDPVVDGGRTFEMTDRGKSV